jgi:hypothetical protein
LTPQLIVPPRAAACLLFVAGALLAGCGSDGDEPSSTAKASPPVAAGCGKFCRQAGGFGGGPPPGQVPVSVPSQEIAVTGDGVAGVRVTCRLARRCVGAILLSNLQLEYGRADLGVPPHGTRVVGVRLSEAGRRYLERQRRDPRVFATVPLIYEDVPLSIGRRLTLTLTR